MKILFDHNVPYGLRKALFQHSVVLADEMGWAELGNGELLKCAEENGFELFITCDQNLTYQQNISGRQIALIVFNTNNWTLLQRSLEIVRESVENCQPGSFLFMEIRKRSS